MREKSRKNKNVGSWEKNNFKIYYKKIKSDNNSLRKKGQREEDKRNKEKRKRRKRDKNMNKI